MKRRSIITVLMVLLASITTFAQVITDATPSISINMSATELLPADQIKFSVTINAEGASPKEAFELHKRRESKLAAMLKDYEIDEESIRFQPVSIQKRYQNNQDSYRTVTRQQVQITFSNFDIYEDIQIALIEHDFDSFNGSFSSSKTEMGKEMALKAAIHAAKEKASLIAEASGAKLGGVKHISYGDYVVGREMVAMNAMAEDTRGVSMMDFGQTVSVSASISIEYYLKY